MIRTYLIENKNKEVLGYFRTLQNAKAYLKKLDNHTNRLLVLKGIYFGEGFHFYQISLDAKNKSFIKIKLQ